MRAGHCLGSACVVCVHSPVTYTSGLCSKERHRLLCPFAKGGRLGLWGSDLRLVVRKYLWAGELLSDKRSLSCALGTNSPSRWASWARATGGVGLVSLVMREGGRVVGDRPERPPELGQVWTVFGFYFKCEEDPLELLLI